MSRSTLNTRISPGFEPFGKRALGKLIGVLSSVTKTTTLSSGPQSERSTG
jgi:hypothetical protein